MSGVFGIYAGQRDGCVGLRLDAMASAMTHRPWYQLDTHVGPGLGLGRLGIGVFNRRKQPAVSEDGRLVCFLTGELYQTEPLRRELREAGTECRNDSDEELVLRLYALRGLDFLPRLEGPFVACIWDAASRRLLIFNDRFARYPLFYAHSRGQFRFAPELKAICGDGEFEPQLNMTAVAEFVRFQRFLGDKTLLDGIRLLKPATVLRYEVATDALRCEPYWEPLGQAARAANLSFDDAVAETGRLLRRSIERLTSDGLRPGLYLSGGLDSRTILGMASAQHPSLPTVTYGMRGSADVVYARSLSKRTGSLHRWFEFVDGNWVAHHAAQHLVLTEGLQSWVHMHGINTVTSAREMMDCNLSGIGGDHFLGGRAYDLLPEAAGAADDSIFEARLFHGWSRIFSWPGFDEGEARLLFTSGHSDLNHLAFESLRSEAAAYRKYPAERRLDHWAWWNHCLRLTHVGAAFLRSHIEMRYPYCDYALVDFVGGLPLHMRREARLHRAVIRRELPALARVPTASDGLPILNGGALRPLVHRALRAGRGILNPHLGGMFPVPNGLYADYELWLRSDLRHWGERVLLDDRTLSRGIFNPDFVRSLWNWHLSGNQLHTIGRIAPLMTLEMALRLFIDGLPVDEAAAVGIEAEGAAAPA